MGFFSELKEDLSQAVNELMPEDAVIQRGSAAKQEPTPDFSTKVSLEEMLENIENVPVSYEEPLVTAATVDEEPLQKISEETEPAKMIVEPMMQEPENLHVSANPVEIIQEVAEKTIEMPVKECVLDIAGTEITVEKENMAEPDITNDLEGELRATFGSEDSFTEMKQPVAEIQEKEDIPIQSEKKETLDEVAYISGAMTVNGDVEVEGALHVAGVINGNVNVSGQLTVTGQIIGAVSALEIYTEGAKIKGEVCGVNAVKIGTGSVIKGNISSNSAVVAGAVKGDIDVSGPVVLNGSAIVVGNIKSKSVQINNGAVIEGMCSQCYADVSPVTFFDE